MVAKGFPVTQNPHPVFTLYCNSTFPADGFSYSTDLQVAITQQENAAMHQQRQARGRLQGSKKCM